jgi:hypothetical protein
MVISCTGVSYGTVTGADLDAFREQADRFIAERDEEYYLHYSGQKEELDLEPIYERYADLTTLERAQAIGAQVNGGSGVRELWRFACEGYIANLERRQAERLAELEATLEATLDGETIPFRELRPRIANEPDRDRRRRLEGALSELVDEHLNPLHLEAIEIVRTAARELAGGSYRDLYVDRFGWRLEELASQCRSFLDSSERLYEEEADRLFRERVGLSLTEAERWDTPRLFRGAAWDPYFPVERMMPALEWTLGNLGIDLRAQPNVELDVEPRPKKDPRAFCVAIEVPERVLLVMKPLGGALDWEVLFHEAGHAEHFAHTSAALKVEERRLGDRAVTEGWASLLQRLTSEPRWLTRMLDFPRPADFAREGGVTLLYIARRYCAKLLYELELFAADDVLPLRERYVELLGDAIKIAPSAANYLADVDSSFYVSEYLRSWAFEAQLRDYLRGRYGSDWFASRKAGGELVELWSEGQKPTADELLRDVTGSELDLESVATRVRELLA